MDHLLALLLGLVIGSFLNVVVARLPERRSIVRPGSHCPHCQAPIGWLDNIPVLSYLLLRGKCRKCSAAISIRYPVIELLTGVLFLAAEMRFLWWPRLLLRDFPFLAILVAVTFIDLEHRIIPDRLSLPGILLGLVTSALLVPEVGGAQALAGAAFGFGVFYLFAWAYRRATGRHGLGGGDVKLLAMIGAFLGPTAVFSTILISSVSGSILGLSFALMQKNRNWSTFAIPYGPFLVVGAIFSYLFYDVVGDILWLPFTKQI